MQFTETGKRHSGSTVCLPLLSTARSDHNRLFVSAAALCVTAMVCLPPRIAAQSAPDSRPITIGAGIMAAPGIDTGFQTGWGLLAGGGFGVGQPSHRRHWRLFLMANFVYEDLGVSQTALNDAKSMNPTNTALQQATGARARFYSATFDPTFRYALKRRISIYGLGGFGWLRRSIDFSGESSGGILLEPSGPSVLSFGGNSGAVDAGIGLNILLRGPDSAIFFVEGRYLHGLAVNRAASLAPISVGFRW